MAHLTICKLRDLGIVTNDFKIKGYNLTDEQVVSVIDHIRYVARTYDIQNYIVSNDPFYRAGRKTYYRFPEDLVYNIIKELPTGALSP